MDRAAAAPADTLTLDVDMAVHLAHCRDDRCTIGCDCRCHGDQAWLLDAEQAYAAALSETPGQPRRDGRDTEGAGPGGWAGAGFGFPPGPEPLGDVMPSAMAEIEAAAGWTKADVAGVAWEMYDRALTDASGALETALDRARLRLAAVTTSAYVEYEQECDAAQNAYAAARQRAQLAHSVAVARP